MEYKLICDSGGEFPCTWVPDYPNRIRVPMTMHLDDVDFVDDDRLDMTAYLAKLKTCKKSPKSSCPSPAMFADAMRDTAHAFVITITSKLSGSYNSAKNACVLLAEQGVRQRVHIFDSKSASAGQMAVSEKIREYIEAGMSFDEVVEKVEAFIQNMKTFFILENLDILIKSGRMSRLTGYVASTLSLRPIMTADNGEIKLKEKARGSVRAFTRLVEIIGENCPDPENRTLYVTHCQNEHQAQFIKSETQKRFRFRDVVVGHTGGLSSMYAYLGGVIVSF